MPSKFKGKTRIKTKLATFMLIVSLLFNKTLTLEAEAQVERKHRIKKNMASAAHLSGNILA